MITLDVPKKYQERFEKLELADSDCEEKYYLYFANSWGVYDGWSSETGNQVITCVPVVSKKEALEFIKDSVKEGADKEQS